MNKKKLYTALNEEMIRPGEQSHVRGALRFIRHKGHMGPYPGVDAFERVAAAETQGGLRVAFDLR